MESVVFVCAAIYNTDIAFIAQGSTKSKCSICAAEVWVVPSAAAILVNYPTAKKVCLECAVQNGYLKNSRIAPMTQEQARELEVIHGTHR